MSLSLIEWIAAVCLVTGLCFNALGVIGILRFPDVFTRLHADTKATTFGSIFTTLSVIIYGANAWWHGREAADLVLVLHALVAVVLLAGTNAVGAHAIARAAYRSGIRPAGAVVDRLAEESSR